MRSTVPRSLVVLMVTAAPLLADVLWRGDFETGTLEQWPGAAKLMGVQVVTAPVRAGRYAVRIDASNAAERKGNDRIEFQHQPKAPGTAEGTERFFAWSLYTPKRLEPGHHSLGYFEVRNLWTQVMAFEAEGEDIKFSTRVPYALRWTGKGRFTPGRWHDFVVHVRWSRDAQQGFVEVWFDGEKVVPLTHTATLRDENEIFLQVGLFRKSSAVPETLFLDQVIEATTLADIQSALPPVSARSLPEPAKR